ncbi:MAG: UPF0104 family protein [Rubripirellula sp.]|nr:UPF0104 family protein [Rubripirellula sp.]
MWFRQDCPIRANLVKSVSQVSEIFSTLLCCLTSLPKPKLRAIAGPVLAAVLFGLAVRLLILESRNITWEEFKTGFTGVPPVYLAIATFLVALNYGLLVGYDLLALRYVCRSLPLRRVALVSFLGYSLGNNLGTLLAATPIRFRFYSRWGLSPSQIVVVITMLGLSFWSGLWVLGGTVLVAVPVELPDEVPLPVGTRTLGALLLCLASAYLVVCFVWSKPLPIGSLRLRPPEPGLMAAQASVAAIDLLISATTLYLVLPADALVPFSLVLAAFLVAIAVSLITQVPGGLGVLEVILLTLLRDTVGDSVLASVLIFRLLYFVLPLFFGMLMLVGHEIYGGALEARNARGE